MAVEQLLWALPMVAPQREKKKQKRQGNKGAPCANRTQKPQNSVPHMYAAGESLLKCGTIWMCLP